jgi:general nucleoside transport system permease protein
MKVGAIAKPISAVILSAALIALVLLALGASPIGVMDALWQGAFGTWLAFTETLVKATPLVFCGLAVAIAFQGALWNIGADGQLIAGATLAGALGPSLGPWPHPLATLAMLAAGAAGGATWGSVAGWLRARRDVNEIISTIMLNFVAAQILSAAVHGPLMEPSRAYPKGAPIAASAELYLYFAPSRLNLGMALAVALAAGCYLFLFHTGTGFELRALGHNRRASAFFGIPIAQLTTRTLALSGALAGLAGAVQISAITHRLYETLSPGWGYEAIAVALVARLNPIAIVATAIFFGGLDNGAQAMQRAEGVSPVLVQVIQGLVIMILLAFDTVAWSGLRAASAGAPSVPAANMPVAASDA